jgi:hypothetical protein
VEFTFEKKYIYIFMWRNKNKCRTIAELYYGLGASPKTFKKFSKHIFFYDSKTNFLPKFVKFCPHSKIYGSPLTCCGSRATTPPLK